MLVAERQQKIVNLINERKSIRVTELSAIFCVTEETIRRDLEKLEKESKLNRSHGGAISKSPSEQREIPHFEREITNIKEKKEIALLAAEQIVAHDTVILDASSTALYMARVLEDMPITVVTNSIKVALELSVKKQITVISIGGKLLPRSLSFVGPLAEASLGNYHVDKAFVSCHSFHLEHGISDSNELQAIIKKKMIECSEHAYIMVDHTKIGRKAFAHISSIDVVDTVITDGITNDIQSQQIRDRSMQLIKGNM